MIGRNNRGIYLTCLVLKLLDMQEKMGYWELSQGMDYEQSWTQRQMSYVAMKGYEGSTMVQQ